MLLFDEIGSLNIGKSSSSRDVLCTSTVEIFGDIFHMKYGASSKYDNKD